MKAAPTAVALAAYRLLSVAAAAVDGVVEINAAAAIRGGVTADPVPATAGSRRERLRKRHGLPVASIRGDAGAPAPGPLALGGPRG